jgi:hypothetical protein
MDFTRRANTLNAEVEGELEIGGGVKLVLSVKIELGRAKADVSLVNEVTTPRRKFCMTS